MTDEQIAREFVKKLRYHCSDVVAVAALTAMMAEARATERARCAAIARLFTYALDPGPERRAAQKMLAEIEED